MSRPEFNPNNPKQIEVEIDDDESLPLDALDHPAEADWLPYIGPTAMVAARHLVWNGPGLYDTSRVADDLGVGVPRLWQAFHRLQRARLATVDGADVTILARWPRNERRSS